MIFWCRLKTDQPLHSNPLFGDSNPPCSPERPPGGRKVQGTASSFERLRFASRWEGRLFIRPRCEGDAKSSGNHPNLTNENVCFMIARLQLHIQTPANVLQWKICKWWTKTFALPPSKLWYSNVSRGACIHWYIKWSGKNKMLLSARNTLQRKVEMKV